MAIRVQRRLAVCGRVGAVHGDGLLRTLVDMKLKDIRPGIMADHIEVEFASDDLRAVDVGDQDRRGSAVGAQYSSTPFAYIAARINGR
jgi:hypothetical protein